MSVDPLVVVLIMVAGCAALIFGVLYLFGRVIGGVGKGVVSLFTGRRPLVPTRVTPGTRMLVCSREQCRKIEYRVGRFCSQCGAPLTQARTQCTG